MEEQKQRERRSDAEAVVEALRRGEVDAVVGSDRQVCLMRLREAEEALRQSEARYRAIVEDQEDLVCRWGPGGELTFVNGAYCRFFGMERADLLGQRFWPSALEDERAVREHLASLGPDRPVGSIEHRVRLLNGEVRWVHWTDRVIFDEEGRVQECQSVGRDVTVRKEVEERLREANARLQERAQARKAQLQEMARELNRSEQRERRRLAQLLHDDLQQLLYAAKLWLDLLVKQRLDGRSAEMVDHAAEMVERGISASRSLTMQLSPPILQESGLVDSLHWLGVHMEEMHGQRIEVWGELEVEESEDVRRIVFEAVRELLFNAVKHAEAGVVQVRVLQPAGQVIRVEVEDNGRGFDVEAWRRRGRGGESFGIWSIEERLELLGGALELESRPGAGCRAVLTLAADC